MKKKITRLITKFGGTVTANSACFWLTHQPEEPDEVKQLKK